MSTFLASALIAHILLGLCGLAGVHFAYMQLLRSKPPYTAILWSTWVATFCFFASWATGAYYYVVYYGGAVKPRILLSGYPWAHQVFMEAKEHVFILIPFLTLLLAVLVHALRSGLLLEHKRTVTILASLILFLGVFVTASGILISGAVR